MTGNHRQQGAYADYKVHYDHQECVYYAKVYTKPKCLCCMVPAGEYTLDMVTKAGRGVVGRHARALTGWLVVPLVTAVPVATSQITTFCSGSLPAERSHMASAEKLSACRHNTRWSTILGFAARHTAGRVSAARTVVVWCVPEGAHKEMHQVICSGSWCPKPSSLPKRQTLTASFMKRHGKSSGIHSLYCEKSWFGDHMCKQYAAMPFCVL